MRIWKDVFLKHLIKSAHIGYCDQVIGIMNIQTQKFCLDGNGLIDFVIAYIFIQC